MPSCFILANIKKGFVWYVTAVFKSLQVRIDILDVILMRRRQKRHLRLVEISSVNKVISLSGQRLYLKSRCILICDIYNFMPPEMFSFLSPQANNNGSLQIICEYYNLSCPARGSTTKFHPLDHLQPIEYHRPDETVLHFAGSRIDLESCNTSLELAEVCSGSVIKSFFLTNPFTLRVL